MLVQVFGHRLHALQDHLGLLADPHQDDPFHCVRLPHEPELPQSRRVSDRHLGQVVNEDRNPALRRHHDVADILGVAHQPQAADVIELAALRIKPAARVGIVAGQLLRNLRDAHAVGEQLVGVEQHLVLHGRAAQSGFVRHALDRTVLPVQHPVVDGLQFLRGPVGALEDIAVDQPARAEQRRHAGRQSGRQGRVAHALEGLLPHEVGIRVVIEVHLHGGEAVERNRAERLQPRDPVHFDLDRNRHQPLHLFGRVARPLRDDLHVRRRQVRIGVDGQLLKGVSAPQHQHQGRHHDQETLGQREGYDT